MIDITFSRFFKLCTGKILLDSIIDIRLIYAVRLLINSAMSVADVINVVSTTCRTSIEYLGRGRIEH